MSVSDKTEAAKARVERAYETAKDKASSAYDSARESAGNAYDSARARAVSAYDSTRQGLKTGARRTGDGIEESPLLALTGGLALGLLIGSLLPRSEREKRALSKVGGDLNDRAHTAYGAARDAGAATLKARGLTPERGEDILRDVVKSVGEAARSSADAATQAVKRN